MKDGTILALVAIAGLIIYLLYSAQKNAGAGGGDSLSGNGTTGIIVPGCPTTFCAGTS